MFIFREPWKNYIKLLCFAVAIYTVAIIFNKLSIQNGWWFRLSDNLFTDFLPIFISVVMLDITYKLGKQQENIQKRQTEIAEQQLKLEKFDSLRNMHRNIYHLEQVSKLIYMHIYSYMTSTFGVFDKGQIEGLIKELDEIDKGIDIDQADYLLRYGENEVMLNVSQYIAHIQVLLTNTLYIPLPPSASENRYYVKRQMELGEKATKLSDEEWIDMIVSVMPTPNNYYIGDLRYFSKRKNELFGENNITISIREKYKA